MFSGLPWKQSKIVLSVLRLHPSTTFQTLDDCEDYSIPSKGFLPTVVNIWLSELNSPILIHFNSLIPKMSVFTVAISFFHHIAFTLIHGANSPGSYAVLFFTALDFTFTTRCTHRWVSFFLWPSLFILSGAVSQLLSSRILETFILSGAVSPFLSSTVLKTYQVGECSSSRFIFFPFHTVLGFSGKEYWSGLPLSSPVDHRFSELSLWPICL